MVCICSHYKVESYKVVYGGTITCLVLCVWWNPLLLRAEYVVEPSLLRHECAVEHFSTNA